MNEERSVTYVHERLILDAINTSSERYKIGKNKGKMKQLKVYKAYKKFYDEKYLPMRESISNLEFDENDIDSFEECAMILNQYWDDIKSFMAENGISDNSKFHTNFMEEFSCYFLSSIEYIDEFDIFVDDVFAGLKIQPNHSICQIKKNVDFCIGRELNVVFDEEESFVLRIPAISVEIKTYVDATMLGEVMNTSRKIKGANPGSKCILLTWINAFADERAYEAAYDSAIDEIIVLSEHKRVSGKPLIIEFTKEGLRDYYLVMKQALKEVMIDTEIPEKGRLLSYVRHMSEFYKED